MWKSRIVALGDGILIAAFTAAAYLLFALAIGVVIAQWEENAGLDDVPTRTVELALLLRYVVDSPLEVSGWHTPGDGGAFILHAMPNGLLMGFGIATSVRGAGGACFGGDLTYIYTAVRDTPLMRATTYTGG